MSETFLNGRVTLHVGDSVDVLKSFPDCSIDAVVTDAPYGLSKEPDIAEVLSRWLAGEDYTHRGKGFMGNSWDSFVPGPVIWREVFRVLKPGGHVLSFFGTRTYDLGAIAIRLAGFEIRDMVSWLYGSGFPKSLDVSKAIDKAAGAEREVLNRRAVKVGFDTEAQGGGGWSAGEIVETAPATDEARQWAGWGTALKPACEPIVMARKPLGEKTVAANVLAHGTGGINIDACRIGTDGGTTRSAQTAYATSGWRTGHDIEKLDAGRFPANVTHDGSDEVVSAFPDTKSGALTAAQQVNGGFAGTVSCYGKAATGGTGEYQPSEGSAARFFYSSKADSTDRMGSGHSTVKPVDLIQYYVRLITPPGGVVLDPFAGSGTMGEAAWREGFDAILIEREEKYAADIRKRLAMTDAGPATRKAASTRKKPSDLPLFGAD